MSNTDLLVKELVQQNGNSRNSLMAVLQGVVKEERYLSEDAMIAIARELDLSAADVYGTFTLSWILFPAEKTLSGSAKRSPAI